MYLPERADWVDVGGDDFGDTPGEEIPDDESAIVTAHGQQCPAAVKGGRHRNTHRVQRTFKVLKAQCILSFIKKVNFSKIL